MILIDNLNILKSSYPNILNQIRQFEDKENRILTEIEETRDGDKTLSITKYNKKVYLHSKYNPIREADAIIESFDDIDKNTNIIFYGTGLGYHIQLILEKYKDIKYYIYEPIPELLYAFLSNLNLKDLKTNRLMGISTSFDGSSIEMFIDRNKERIKIVELPSHKQHFPEENKGFNEMMFKIIKVKRSSLATNYSFQKRWIVNSMKNLKEVLSTPNIILEKKGDFKGKTAILVAAGPSLNDEIENLRCIKEKELAYIFSVGSAINTLIHHNIYPDVACTYDPTEQNQIVFDKVKEKGIKGIPMIFGSSVGYETLENYPGDKYHMITSQDTIARYFLKDEDGNDISVVQDAPSIAVVTLQLLYILGFSTIILVGQNLGYRGEESYSKGISYRGELINVGKEEGITVKDVYGEEILTNRSLYSTKKQMEMYINTFSDINVINTTKGGAHIQGTTFYELENMIETTLKEKQVEEQWLGEKNINYDNEYLTSQLNRMDKSYNNAIKINNEFNIILTKIEKAIKNMNYIQAENLYIKLDNVLKKVEDNDFYKVFILPMNRVEYKLLADSIDNLNEKKNPYVKGKLIVDNFRKFINICTRDIEMIEPIYNEIKMVCLKS